MKIKFHLDPLWVSFHFGKLFLDFGFYNKLELYSDETSGKPQLKTRKNGYIWFCTKGELKPFVPGSYDRMIQKWNAKK